MKKIVTALMIVFAASAQAFHFARFVIDEDVLTVSVLDENGALLDQFSVSK